MIVGKIYGKITTTSFYFTVKGDAKKFDYVQVYHKDYEFVLCQIVEIERKDNLMSAFCSIIGYKKDGKILQIRTPFESESEVLKAEDNFIQSIIQLKDNENGAFMGFLEGKKIPIRINLSKLLTTHLAVLAKSGAGKSYAVGVLLEEILERKVPLVIFDPHGEYGDLAFPNEKDDLSDFGIEKKGYKVKQYGNPEISDKLIPIKLPFELSQNEVLHLLPAKLSSNQQNILYSAMQGIDKISLPQLIDKLEAEDNNAKFSVISVVSYLMSLGIFSPKPIHYQNLVKSGTATIINLKGIDPEIQEIISSKLLNDLFEKRKKGEIPPFFTVIEEAHIFCPERSFGETKASKILRTIASEGRKFGLGLCVVSQRPARIDKSVLSQCSTQIILKVTNPNDLKAISSSVEGINSEAEKEIKNLPIGTALITGVVDAPLFVSIRPRRSKHGGSAVNILEEQKEQEKFNNIMPIIEPRISIEELSLIEGKDPKLAKKILRPAVIFTCKRDEEFSLLYDLSNGCVKHEDKNYFLPELSNLSKEEIKILKIIHKNKSVNISDFKENGFNSIDFSLKKLLEKDYVLFEEGYYTLNDSFLFSNPVTKQNLEKIIFKQTSYEEILPKKRDIEYAKKEVEQFASVIDYQECYLLEIFL